MSVSSNDFVRFKDFAETPTSITVAFGDLTDALDRVFVERAEFPDMTEALFQKLLPYAACLRGSVCRVPSQFASQDLVTRAFSELLCGQVLHIDDRLCVGGTRDYWGYTGSFMALPCVEYCRVLSLGNPDLVFRIREQLIDWICTGDPKKTFYVRIDVRLAPVVLGGYARSMLRRFRLSDVAAEFELVIFAKRDVGEPFSEYPSLEATNERTEEAFNVTSVQILHKGQDYARVSYNRRPESPDDS